MKYPADFTSFPYSSVARKTETEIVAQNIMVILTRTGNFFRPLPWPEYEMERLKDGNFTESEREHFVKAVKYCESQETAELFSESWRSN